MTIGADTSPGGHHLVEAQPRQVALPVAEPADPRRQPLEAHALGGQLDPAADVVLLAEQLEDRAVGRVDVGGVAGQRHPAERSLALAEQRPDVGRHEARIGERVLVPVVGGHAAQRVAVVERLGAARGPSERMASTCASTDSPTRRR